MTKQKEDIKEDNYKNNNDRLKENESDSDL